MKRTFSILISAWALFLLSSCTYEPYVEPEIVIPTDSVSFGDIEDIFVDRACTGCHPTSGGLDLTPGNSFASIMSNSLVNLTSPTESILYTKPASSGSHSKKYTAQQEVLVLTWIQQGAHNN
ncbi:MAG TPA: hypothetical protein DCQ26_10995 [Marinilabiliales bacterium]|jgi:hypothetical protein|nr:MAG: hypothetical protein A2W95_00430 [Bacteroidetes bacterium GWA2_40_14]OFX60181.1 MAG: hypothetical protein A2W84_11395 [Bacteroidetes bacterium GWC2_40_13]OFX71023.1 MAG: hypothetical protein A2W96_11145 [Bacteroidetes bacterium GWD2_40_43]OFX92315.1 MAG: hypothetical protein A2W97_10125 [Bacteroidetes bacterium GWE2_40_63]OFY22918.1 MAG: hypothetical protein A2W88_04110 [Bacteroidetes bacterium GWF2_40_13]OFZ29992.1 MAG: hypothetical protein A2437_00860 [Bacteroidetes bacterium RIFOXYC